MPFYIIIPFILLLFNKSKTRFYLALKVFVSIYIFLWIVLFSNEIRYLFPLILILSMFGYEQLVDFLIKANYKNLSKKTLYVFFILVISLMITIYVAPKKSVLIKLNKEEKIKDYESRYDFDRETYYYILDLFEKDINKSKKLVTNFQLIRLTNFSENKKIILNTSFKQINNAKQLTDLSKFNFLLLYKNCKNFKFHEIKEKLMLIRKFSSEKSCLYKVL